MSPSSKKETKDCTAFYSFALSASPFPSFSPTPPSSSCSPAGVRIHPHLAFRVEEEARTPAPPSPRKRRQTGVSCGRATESEGGCREQERADGRRGRCNRQGRGGHGDEGMRGGGRWRTRPRGTLPGRPPRSSHGERMQTTAGHACHERPRGGVVNVTVERRGMPSPWTRLRRWSRMDGHGNCRCGQGHVDGAA